MVILIKKFHKFHLPDLNIAVQIYSLRQLNLVRSNLTLIMFF